MSTQVNQYMCFGYMLDFHKAMNHLTETLGDDGYAELVEEYYDSAFKEEWTEVNGCTLLEDGMGGEYTFFGRVFAKASDGNILQTMEIPKIMPKFKKNLEKEFQRIFNGKFDVKPKYILVTHYR